MTPRRRSSLVSKNENRISRPRPSANLRSAPVLTRKAASSRTTATAVAPASKSEKSRDSILIAAARLFRRQGYSATTLRQIAAMAKIKAGSVYYYFDSKEQILDEVLHLGLLGVFEA